MRNIFVTPNHWLRNLLPLAQTTRRWSWKYFDRTAQRLVVSGGRIRFLDAELNFPEGVGLAYSNLLYWQGPDAYELATSRVLATLIARSRVFLDIGSNMGIYSVYAGVRFPDVTTIAFEPVPSIWRKNVLFHQANGLSEKSVLKLALSDQEQVQQFFLPTYTTGLEEEQTGTLNAGSWQTREAQVEKIDVECTTLDKFAANQGLPAGRCCVKIDVENHEAAALRGAREFLRSRRPWIVCEILPSAKIDPVTGQRLDENQEVAALLDELRYALFAITAEGMFRVTAVDFEPPRTFKDFLLIPMELLRPNLNYLPVSGLEALLTAT